MEQGIVSIRYDVDYSAVIKARSAIRDTLFDISKSYQATANTSSRAFEQSHRSIRDGSRLIRDSIQEQQDAHVKLFRNVQKADEAGLQSHLRFEDLKKEYSIKSLDEIRDAIMRSEVKTRELRAARYEEIKKGEQEVAKIIQQRINEESAGLQMLRSLEKERIGRTFTEQLENNFRGNSIVSNILNIKQQFAGIREVASQPSSGSGILGTLGGFATKAVPIAAGIATVGTALKGVIDIGTKYEDSLLDLQAITGLTDKQTESLGNKARELGKRWGVDAASGVESFKFVISALGPQIAKDQDAVNSMGNSIMTLAKASGVDAQEATRALTTTLSQFGYNTLPPKEQATQMARIMNVLAAAAQQGNAEVPQLSESMKEVGTVAAQKKISVEGAAAALEVLAANEIKGSEAGTAYRNVLTLMSSGTEKAVESLSGMGLTFKDINPEVVGQQKALETLKKGLDSIKDPTERAAAMQKIFGRENIAAANILLNNTKQLSEMEKAITGTTVAQEQAEIKQRSAGETWKRITVTVKDLAITLFQSLKPAIDAILSIFESLLPVLTVVTDILGGGLSIAFQVATVPVKIFWSIITGFTEAWSAFLGWLGKVTGVTTIVVNAFNWLKNAVADVWQWIKDKYDDARALLSDITFGALGTSREDIDKEKAQKAAEQSLPPPEAVPPPVNPPEALEPIEKTKGRAKSRLEVLRDEYQARKSLLEQALERENAILAKSFADGSISEQKYRDEKIIKEKAHYNNLIAIESEFYVKFQKVDKSESEKHALERDKANTKIAELSRDQRQNSLKDLSANFDKELLTLKTFNSNQLSELELHHEKGEISEREYGRRRNALQEQYLTAQISAYADYADKFKEIDEAKYKQALASQAEAERALALMRAQNAKKEREEILKERREIEDREIALMKDGVDKKLALENLRFERELEAVKNNVKLKELVIAQHELNVHKITEDAEKERLKKASAGVDAFAGFFEQGYYKRLGYAQDTIEKEVLHVDKGFLRQRGLLKAFLTDFLKQKLSAYIADTTAHLSSEQSKTAATETGVLQRAAMFAVEIGKTLAAAAASIAGAIASAWAWLVGTLGPFGLAAAAAATATIVWQWGNIKRMLGFRTGGPVTGEGYPDGEDTVPAMLSKGEYVLNPKAVKRVGKTYLDALNYGEILPLKFAAGGAIDDPTQTQSLRIGGFSSGILRQVPSPEMIKVVIDDSTIAKKLDSLISVTERKDYVSILDQRANIISMNKENYYRGLRKA